MSVPDAVFSKDRVYRYILVREWEKSKPTIMFVGLNPSTADELNDDPTVRRLIGYAKRWGYGRLIVVNAFAYRATYPKNLFSYNEPVGPENDLWIKKASREADISVLAYGNLAKNLGRHEEILNIVDNPYCIKVSKIGLPMHPLYLKYTDKPLKFEKFK